MIDRAMKNALLSNGVLQHNSDEDDDQESSDSTADLTVHVNGIKLKATGKYTVLYVLIGLVVLYFSTQ